MARKPHPLIVVVGMCGSGKSLVAKHLKLNGWHAVRFGGITIDELNKKGLPWTEENEKEMREAIRRKKGMAAYAERLLPTIKEALAVGPVVIDGLYCWSEYKLLRERIPNPMYVVAIFSRRALRYERLAKRAIRPLPPAEAERRDYAEIEGLEKGGPIAMADYLFVNEGSEEELCRAIDAFVSAGAQFSA